MMDIVAGAVPALLLVGVVIGLLVVNKRAVGGFWLWEQRRLLREGLAVTGRVLHRADRGMVRSNGRIPIHRWELVVEVSSPGSPPRRLSVSYDESSFDPMGEVGKLLPLRIDPRDEQRVMLDWDALDRAKTAAEAEAKRKSEEERRALLEGRPPRAP